MPGPVLCQLVRKMEEEEEEKEAEADLAGEHPWCAAATWCHRLPPAPWLLRLQSKVFTATAVVRERRWS